MPGFFTTQPDKWASVQGACRLGSRGWPTLRFAGLAASWKTGFAPHVHLDFSRAALETLLAVVLAPSAALEARSFADADDGLWC